MRTCLGIPLLAVALSIGGCSSCSKPSKKSKGQPKQQAVAKLTKIVGSVDYRAAKTLAWRPASVRMDLYHRDALKTGSGSRSRVTFKSGAELEIEERSLVVIEAPEVTEETETPATKKDKKEKKPLQVARLEKGTLRGVAKPGMPAVQVVTPDGRTTEIRAKGEEPVPFRIRSRKGGKMEVAVLKGTAEVRSGEDRVVLKPRQAVDVSKSELSQPVTLPPYPELAAPPVDAKVEAGSEMELRWQPVDAAAMYRVQVSHQVSFGERLHDTTVVGLQFRLPAPEAKRTYVWRVASVDAQGRESEFGFARRFHVQRSETAAGQLLAPIDNAGFQYVKKPGPVFFRWKGEGKSFLLVVARDPSLKKRVVFRRRCKEPAEKIKGLRAGTYYWGVFVREGRSSKPLFDKPNKFVIARRLPPYVKVPRSIDWK
jgi:hypothetical protein